MEEALGHNYKSSICIHYGPPNIHCDIHLYKLSYNLFSDYIMPSNHIINHNGKNPLYLWGSCDDLVPDNDVFTSGKMHKLRLSSIILLKEFVDICCVTVHIPVGFPSTHCALVIEIQHCSRGKTGGQSSPKHDLNSTNLHT